MINLTSQFQNVPFCPISASGSNFNPRNTTCIPVVKIFAFLDLEQISADFEIEHFETASNFQYFYFVLSSFRVFVIGFKFIFIKTQNPK